MLVATFLATSCLKQELHLRLRHSAREKSFILILSWSGKARSQNFHTGDQFCNIYWMWTAIKTGLTLYTFPMHSLIFSDTPSVVHEFWFTALLIRPKKCKKSAAAAGPTTDGKAVFFGNIWWWGFLEQQQGRSSLRQQLVLVFIWATASDDVAFGIG